MIAHIVLCKPQDPSSTQQQSELAAALSELATVPGVRGFSTGEDFSGRSQGYSQAMIMYFDGRDALQAYMTHPQHMRIVGILNQLAPDRIVIDYETGSSAISTAGDSVQSPS